MAIVFQKKVKKQKTLIIVFLVLVVLLGLIFWKGEEFFSSETEIDVVNPFKKIKLDFSVFDSAAFKKLAPSSNIPEFENGLGKENPFIPLR